jgi:hypothetical protein
VIAFKGVKMTTAKSTSIVETRMSYTARFNEKGCLQVWGGDALRTLHLSIMFLMKLPPKALGFSWWF